jgi:hypothetical protein
MIANTHTHTWGHPTILDPISEMLRTAQLQWAQERVSQTGKLVIDTLSPSVTDKDREMAKILRTENSIARWDALYLKYRERLSKTILQYMENLWIEADILRYVEKMFKGVQYKSTYTEENPEILEEPGSMGEVSACFADISQLPVVVSMRHVQDMAWWNMGEDIASGKLTIWEAIEQQYLCVLLHEFLHVASTRIYELESGYIWRIGIHCIDEAAESIWDMNMYNEWLTDIIAWRIFRSESMGKYYPWYSKYFSKIYHDIMIATERDSWTFQETMHHVERWYFGSLEYADMVRVNIFDAESLF